MGTARGLMLGLALLACAGCSDSVTGPTVELNAEATLAPGESVRVESTNLSLRFEGVEGDSRCPADAICILGGDAVARVTVIAGDTQRSYELHTGSMQPVRHDAFVIAMVTLAPYPFSARPIAPGDYRLTVRVTR
jgi:hypothetical protein